jgi:transglutaminase-like putative cysteine protease
VPFVALLRVHPSRGNDLQAPDELKVSSATHFECYSDSFGNNCCRFLAQPGTLRLTNSTTIRDSGEPDPVAPWTSEIPVEHLPNGVLPYLLNSRYCEVDRMSEIAAQLFGGITPGWNCVQAVCTWVHERVTFGYQYANCQKTALDVYGVGLGVCRDFQHLAITMCRALNIPARYATGYLGDIGVPTSPAPMGFQRLVRSVSGRPLVDVRCAPQYTSYCPRAYGGGTRRFRRGHYDFVRHRDFAAIHRSHGRSGRARGGICLSVN